MNNFTANLDYETQFVDELYLQELLWQTSATSSKGNEENKSLDTVSSPSTSISSPKKTITKKRKLLKKKKRRKVKTSLQEANEGSSVKQDAVMGKKNKRKLGGEQEEEQKLAKIKKKKKGKSDGESSTILCGICYEKKSRDEFFGIEGCNHLYCKECVSYYVGAKIRQNIIVVECPMLRCGVRIKPENCRDIIPLEVLGRWESALCEASILASEKFYCPFKECSALLMDDGTDRVTACECPFCHRLFCAQCRVPWHGDLTCVEFQRSENNRNMKIEDDLVLDLAKEKNWMKCSNCKHLVEKKCDYQCEHIMCRCGHEFCYICGKSWMLGHTCQSRVAPYTRLHVSTLRRDAPPGVRGDAPPGIRLIHRIVAKRRATGKKTSIDHLQKQGGP